MNHGLKSMVIGWRSILLTLIATGVATLIGAMGPLDRMIEMGIGHVAWRPVSGDIVVVGIDEKSLRNIRADDSTVELHAAIIKKIREQGANRLFIDFSYEARTNDPKFPNLTSAVKSFGDKAVLAVPISSYTGNEGDVEFWPSAAFGDQAQKACICWEYKYWQVWDIPYSIYAGDKVLPSFSSIMANRPLTEPSRFFIDYSYRTDSIPHYSAHDLLNNAIPKNALVGKDVVFAGMARSFGDEHYFPGHDLVAGSYIHIIAGETLKRGDPMVISWYPALLIAVLLVGYLIFTQRHQKFLLVAGMAAAGIFFTKILLFYNLINVTVGPALFYLAASAFFVARARNKQSAQHHNSVSGLPNFSAMRALPSFGTHTVVAAQIVNFDELVTYLPPESSTEVVRQIARRLSIATIGADLHHDSDGSFAWLSPRQAPDALDAQLAGLAALFNAPITLDNRRIDVKIAFGINDEAEGSNAQRIAAARSAAETAQRGRNLIERYSGAQADASWKLSFHSQLEDAMAAGDIWVAFQPQFHIKSGALIGIEALARWTHPERGMIPPDQFIVQAEKSQDIYQLTLFVMERAIQSGAELHALGHDIATSVNLSAALLDRSDLASTIRVMLLSHNYPASKLTIEITETAQFEDSPQALQTLAQLRQQGICLSIDDYGTGQSNLEYLTRIEADEIKIDKRFVKTMRDSQRNFEIVKSTIELAHRLGAVAVAEGIEDLATLNLLEKLGCDVAQGYYLGKPQLFFEIVASLTDNSDTLSA